MTSFSRCVKMNYQGTLSSPAHKEASQDVDNLGGFSHLPALDGVRGSAVLLVLMSHILSWNGHSGRWFFDVLAEIRSLSWVGVNLFFALSGFLITGILVNTLSVGNFFKIFYARRALRIFPLYYGFLLLLLLLTRPLHFTWNGWQYFYLTYTANLAVWWNRPLLLSNFRIGHFWSLQVEEQFYFIWPLVVYRVKTTPRLIRLSLITCAVVFFIRIVLVVFRVSCPAGMYLPYTATFACCDNLLYGCVLALLLRTHWRERVLSYSPVVFIACASPVLLERVIRHGTPWTNTLFMPTFGFSLIGIGSASLIAMSLRSNSVAHRAFSLPALRFFGRYSYGLYIVHYSVQGLFGASLYPFFYKHLHVKFLSDLLSAGVILGISTLLAVLSYHLLEIHFLKLKRYFSYEPSKIGINPSLLPS
jgi:peptidoglycan/LPS O-acetylase OafA/YrhL